jgi:hypothetical protein
MYESHFHPQKCSALERLSVFTTENADWPILSGLQQLDLKLGASPIDLLTETANQGTCTYM